MKRKGKLFLYFVLVGCCTLSLFCCKKIDRKHLNINSDSRDESIKDQKQKDTPTEVVSIPATPTEVILVDPTSIPKPEITAIVADNTTSIPTKSVPSVPTKQPSEKPVEQPTKKPTNGPTNKPTVFVMVSPAIETPTNRILPTATPVPQVFEIPTIPVLPTATPIPQVFEIPTIPVLPTATPIPQVFEIPTIPVLPTATPTPKILPTPTQKVTTPTVTVPTIALPTPTPTPAKQDQMVASVEQMRQGEFKENQQVMTQGYYTPGDGGGATYTIIKTNEKENGISYIQLKNGLTARLHMDSNSYINVMQAGIRIGDEISDRLNQLIPIAASQSRGIKFNDGQYLIGQRIQLSATEYIGEDHTELFITPDFKSKGNTMFTNDREYSALSTGGEITMKKLRFVVECTKEQGFAGAESILVQLKGMERCTIDQCSFSTRTSESSNCETSVDLLWFYDGSTRNVSVTNCSFSNQAAKNMTRDHWTGGCIWISSFHDNNTIENVNINHCNFYSECADETIAIWRAKDSNNITIESCDFTVDGKLCDNILAFYNSNYRNFLLKNNTFNIKTSCTFTTKFFTNQDKNQFFDVKMEGCTYNLINQCEDTVKRNIAVITISGITNELSHFDFKNNQFLGQGSTKYRLLMSAQKGSCGKINFSENKVDFTATSGLLSIAQLKAKVDIQNNEIRLGDNSTFMLASDLSERANVNVTNNDIYNRIVCYAMGNMNLEYSLINNNIQYDKGSFVFQNKDIKVTEKCVLNINGNTYLNRNKIWLYYSGQKDDPKDYLIVNSTDGF